MQGILSVLWGITSILWGANISTVEGKIGTGIGLISDWENGIDLNGTGLKLVGMGKNYSLAIEWDWEILFLGLSSVQ